MTFMDVIRAGESVIATGAACVALAVWRLPDVADVLAGALRRGAAWLALRLNARAEALRRSRAVYAEVYRHVIDGYTLDRISLHWDGTREVKVIGTGTDITIPTLAERRRLIEERLAIPYVKVIDPGTAGSPNRVEVHGPEYDNDYDPTRGPDPAEEGRME